MAIHHRIIASGLKLPLAKLMNDKDRGWVSVVLADDLEEYLKTHKCEPVGDTAEILLSELWNEENLDGINYELYERIKKLFAK